jgi:hypothetical protein
MYRWLAGSQSLSRRFLEEKNLFFLPGFEPWTVQPLLYSLYKLRRHLITSDLSHSLRNCMKSNLHRIQIAEANEMWFTVSLSKYLVPGEGATCNNCTIYVLPTIEVWACLARSGGCRLQFQLQNCHWWERQTVLLLQTDWQHQAFRLVCSEKVHCASVLGIDNRNWRFAEKCCTRIYALS